MSDMTDAIEMASYLGLEGQGDEESDRDFRLRVAGVLRDKGRIIEAQEIRTGRRFDDPSNPPLGEPNNPMTGILGASAAALQGIDFHTRGETRVEDEAVIGRLALEPPDPTERAILAAFDLLGPDAMDFLGGGR